MADEPLKTPPPPAPEEDSGAEDDTGEDPVSARERIRLGDFVRRAVSAGVEAASGSKDMLVRVATAEIRNWLDHLDLDQELVRALSKLTLEVKAEIKFRVNDDGKLVPEPVLREAKVDNKGDPKARRDKNG